MSEVVLGPVVISSARFAAAIGLMAFIVSAELIARRDPGLKRWASHVLFIVLLGARAGYVLENFDVFRSELLTVLYFWQGGFSPLWGLVAAGLYTVFTGSRSSRALGVAAIGLVAWGGAAMVTTAGQPRNTVLPTLTLETLRNEPTPLTAHADAPLVLNLWATWCPPCRRELPMLVDMAATHEDSSFVFAHQGGEAAGVEAFLKQHGLLDDAMLLDSTGELGRLLEAVALPTTFFFRADGTLAYRHAGEISRAEVARRIQEME